MSHTAKILVKEASQSLWGRNKTLLVQYPNDLVSRIGKCIMFGCSQEQLATAAEVLKKIARRGVSSKAGALGFFHLARSHWRLDELDVAEDRANRRTYLRDNAEQAFWFVQPTKGTDPKYVRGLLNPAAKKGLHLWKKSTVVHHYYAPEAPDKLLYYFKIKKADHWLDRPIVTSRDDSLEDKAGPRRLCNLQTETAVFSSGRRRLLARTVSLWEVNAMTGHEKPDIEWLDAQVERLRKCQNRATTTATETIEELMDAVDELERKTWKRPGAVEDLGSAAPPPEAKLKAKSQL